MKDKEAGNGPFKKIVLNDVSKYANVFTRWAS